LENVSGWVEEVLELCSSSKCEEVVAKAVYNHQQKFLRRQRGAVMVIVKT
jgi:hypothetical protein